MEVLFIMPPIVKVCLKYTNKFLIRQTKKCYLNKLWFCSNLITMGNNLITEFVEGNVVDAMGEMLATTDVKKVKECAKTVAGAFLGGGEFTGCKDNPQDCEQHLLHSFQKNTILLVQKTWVEKDDVSLKEQVLYKLDQFCTAMKDEKWTNLYPAFREIITDIVYLMFGSQAKSKDFNEYALRIDPEFGIFWWYFEQLPVTVDWADEKSFYVLLVGMFFLANY